VSRSTRRHPGGPGGPAAPPSRTLFPLEPPGKPPRRYGDLIAAQIESAVGIGKGPIRAIASPVGSRVTCVPSLGYLSHELTDCRVDRYLIMIIPFLGLRLVTSQWRRRTMATDRLLYYGNLMVASTVSACPLHARRESQERYPDGYLRTTSDGA